MTSSASHSENSTKGTHSMVPGYASTTSNLSTPGYGQPALYSFVTNRDINPYYLTHTVQIDALKDDALELKQSISVEIRADSGQIIAAFEEAGLVTSGDFAAEAIDWLKDTIASNFKLFRAERQALGPLPRRQLAVLEKYVGKKQNRKKRRS